MRCFLRRSTSPPQDLPAYHAAFSELKAVDLNRHTSLLFAVTLADFQINHLRIIVPNVSTVVDRIHHSFYQIVEVWFRGMEMRSLGLAASILGKMRFWPRHEKPNTHTNRIVRDGSRPRTLGFCTNHQFPVIGGSGIVNPSKPPTPECFDPRLSLRNPRNMEVKVQHSCRLQGFVP